MIVFHGTSIQNAKSIIANGFQPRNRNWKVSEKLAYVFNYESDLKTGFESALLQGSAAAFKNITECRRAVLALEVNPNDISSDSTGTAGNMAFQFNGKILPGSSVVGCWYDSNNLYQLRPFLLVALTDKVNTTHNVNINKELIPFFQPPPNTVKVSIKELFSKVDLGFNPTKFKYPV